MLGFLKKLVEALIKKPKSLHNAMFGTDFVVLFGNNKTQIDKNSLLNSSFLPKPYFYDTNNYKQMLQFDFLFTFSLRFYKDLS